MRSFPQLVLVLLTASCGGPRYETVGSLKTFIDEHPAEARAMLVADCDDGYRFGCYAASYFFLSGIGGEQDTRRALQLSREACHREHPQACWNAGVMLWEGGAEPQDRAVAKSLFRRACEVGDGDLCAQAADAFFERDPALYRELLGRACDAGVGERCHELAAVYYQGIGTESDPDRALDYLRAGCAHGIPRSCMDAARMRLQQMDGRAGLREYSEIGRLLREACNAGDALGCRHAARLYREAPSGWKRLDLASCLEKRARVLADLSPDVQSPKASETR